jgi:hypothetical protein
MSIATMAARVHAMTPEDELIGSMTRERVSLLVRYTGGHKFLEVGFTPAQLWLAHMLDTEVPAREYDDLIAAFTSANMVEEADLDLWFDMDNSEATRGVLQRQADYAVDVCVMNLTNLLCTQLGVS